jgi:hypothetical protein
MKNKNLSPLTDYERSLRGGAWPVSIPVTARAFQVLYDTTPSVDSIIEEGVLRRVWGARDGHGLWPCDMTTEDCFHKPEQWVVEVMRKVRWFLDDVSWFSQTEEVPEVNWVRLFNRAKCGELADWLVQHTETPLQRIDRVGRTFYDRLWVGEHYDGFTLSSYLLWAMASPTGMVQLLYGLESHARWLSEMMLTFHPFDPVWRHIEVEEQLGKEANCVLAEFAPAPPWPDCRPTPTQSRK